MSAGAFTLSNIAAPTAIAYRDYRPAKVGDDKPLPVRGQKRGNYKRREIPVGVTRQCALAGCEVEWEVDAENVRKKFCSRKCAARGRKTA